MKNNKVLVLMATYNGEKFLKKQLDSIFGQKDVEVSLLVRDDGSNDKTISILEDYQQNFNVKIIDAKDDSTHGPMHNYYSLLNIVKKSFLEDFDYFALSDQDDIWLNNKLYKMISDFTSLEAPQLVYANYSVIDEKDNELIINTNQSIGIEPPNFLALLFNNSFAWGHSIMFNASLLANISLSNKIMKSGFPHDAYLAKFAVLCEGIFYEDDILVKYRRYNNNVSGMWYKFSLKMLLSKINMLKESKIYANLVNASLLTIEENSNSNFIKEAIITKYKTGIKLTGLKNIIFMRKNYIFRKQWQRNLNMKLMYALGWYKKWVFRDKKMEKL